MPAAEATQTRCSFLNSRQNKICFAGSFEKLEYNENFSNKYNARIICFLQKERTNFHYFVYDFLNQR